MPIYQGKPSFAESLSSSIGTGLGNLAQLKMQEIERQHKLSDTLAVNKQKMQMAQQLQQSKLAQQLASKQAESRNDYNAFLQAGASPEQAEAWSIGSPNVRGAAFKNQLAAPGRKQLAEYLASQQGQENISGEGDGASPNIPFPSEITPQDARIIQAQQKMSQAERFHKDKQQARFEDKIEPRLKELDEARTGADEIIRGLDKMDQLLESGNMSWPITVALTDTLKNGIFGLGLDLSSILAPETGEFKKIEASFLKQASNYLPGNMTNAKMKAWLQMFPSATQNEETNYRLAQDVREMVNYGRLRADLKDDIIKNNGGKVPKDIFARIDARSKDEGDALVKRINDSIKLGKIYNSLGFSLGEDVGALPDVSTASEGDEYIDNGILKKLVNGQWVAQRM